MKQSVKKRSIFRALFVPMILIMILQALIFYVSAMYGGIEESLSQNAVDILSGRLNSRKYEIETRFNNRWTALDDCIEELNGRYSEYVEQYGLAPFQYDAKPQISFLNDSADCLIDTLRFSQSNGIFLILNDKGANADANSGQIDQKYGLCIRDMDQDSNYSGREDLLLERSPSSIVDSLGCSLDSWWEAKYSFKDSAEGDYYYQPLTASIQRPDAESKDLAYLSGVHQLSGSDPKVISYSVPLCGDDGQPYAVLGIEISVNYLSSLLPNAELGEKDHYSYIFAMQEEGSNSYQPVVGTGSLYTRCFGAETVITRGDEVSTGGFTLTGRVGEPLYAADAGLQVYNNNNPFENRRFVLLAVAESATLFSYVEKVKTTLLLVSVFSLMLGIAGLTFVSRRFAKPITALAQRVRSMDEYKSGDSLSRLGITEIDQLVDSIEQLNRNVSQNSARTEFFSRMSHDMRTPMNAIISFSSAEMLEGANEEVKDEYLDKIHDSGTYLLGLINEVLDMTKIESKQTGIKLSWTQASDLFKTSLHIVEELARKKNIELSTEIDIPAELWIMADKQHISQVVMNLLSNAVKFTPMGGSVRFLAGIIGDEHDAQIKILVSDTGIGMSKVFMKNLYKPFEQEHSDKGGTGLGLSIAKKLVDLMGGSIDCESEQGVGTQFTVILPLPRYSNSDEGQNPIIAPQLSDISALIGKRVLVCEDNEINNKIFTKLLNRVGMEVDVAENGKLGVDLVSDSEEGRYCAILMDIRMPVMDGLAATRAIRALNRPDSARIPIIAMTADAFAEDEKSSIAAGMNEHLSKPVEPSKLYETLLRYVK